MQHWFCCGQWVMEREVMLRAFATVHGECSILCCAGGGAWWYGMWLLQEGGISRR